MDRRTLILIWLLPLIARADEASFGGMTMGTRYAVRFLQPSPPISVEEVRRDVDGLLARLERAMSTYRDDSDVSRFSAQRGTDWFAVSADTARVVLAARDVSRLTDGAFDVTADPLARLWGFGPQRHTGAVPQTEAIEAARRRVDWRKLEARLDPPALRKSDPGLSVDLSGIAKGYAVDAIAAHLESLGIRDWLVGIAGELRARGSSKHGRAWQVGIEKPLDKGSAIARVIELNDCAVSTSGDYRNFFIADGRRYGHVMDPRSGRPVANGMASVSVVGASGARADALATALMVLGADAGCALAEREGLPCLFILRDGDGFSEKMTPAFEKLLRR
jgi:thiamine biosynthesis lipoprotein